MVFEIEMPQAYRIPFPEDGNDLEFLQAFPQKFKLRYNPMVREHRFEGESRGKLDSQGPLFRKLAAGMIPKRWHEGRPILWRIKWPKPDPTNKVKKAHFSLALGSSGSVQYWGTGWGPLIAKELYDFLVKKCGFTDDEFVEFVHNLYLARIELASQVEENGLGVLKKGTMAYVNLLFPDDVLPPGKAWIKIDESGDYMEYETGGTTRESRDLHNLVVRPAQTLGHIAAIHAELLRQKPYHEKTATEVTMLRPAITQAEASLRGEIQKTWHPLSILNKGVMRTEEKVGQLVIALQELEKKQEDVGGISKVITTLKIVGSRIVNAINRSNDRFEEKLDEVHDHLEENNTEAELRNTELSNDMAQQHLEEKILITGVLDQARQNNRDIQQVDLHQKIYAEGILENQREIKRVLQGYHQGQVYQTAFIARRVQQLDDRMVQMGNILVSLGKVFDISLPDLVKRIAEIRDLLEHLKAKLGGNRIHQDALNPLALVYLVLGRFPDLPYRKIADLLGLKVTRIYGLVGKLEALGITGREKRFPTIEPLDPVAVGSISRTADDPTVPEGVKPTKTNTHRRPIWHVFRRNRSAELKVESNEKLKPEDEKT